MSNMVPPPSPRGFEEDGIQFSNIVGHGAAQHNMDAVVQLPPHIRGLPLVWDLEFQPVGAHSVIVIGRLAPARGGEK